MIAAQPIADSAVPPEVLFLDDDVGVRRLFQRIMKAAGIPADVVGDPKDALARLAQDPRYSVIVADYWMPEMDGAMFLRRAAELAPAASRILLSGNLELPAVVRAINSGGIYQVLAKPWDSEQLVPLIRRAQDRAHLELENARLLKELKTKNDELQHINHALDTLVMTRTTNLLDGLISALDLRDTETQWHSRRVAAYARRLATELGIHGQELVDIEYGAMLHDVGKIGIPDSILRKPGPLSEEEWVVMRTHPRLGYDLLQHIDFLARAALVPYHHHERFDGNGYPQRLAGDQIIVGARIFAVVDTLDVITTNRPYRRARDFAAARAEILRCTGSQFDPEIVAAYARIPDDEWKAIQNAHISEDEHPSASIDMKRLAI
ncbi:HD domain-containing protein [Myxococcota bacterium]|nr:HD domain-containing protein [Myxococcota bacterium]